MLVVQLCKGKNLIISQHFYEWFSIKFSFYVSIFLFKSRMLKSCRISSFFFGSLNSFIFCGIYVKLLILNKLYFNLLIILGSQKGAPIGAQKLAPGSQKGAPIGA